MASENQVRERHRGVQDVVVLTISVLADRPDLVTAMWDMPNSWPEFMRHDPTGALYYGNVVSQFADYVLIAQDPDGAVVASAFSIPFVLGGAELPPDGWDAAIRSGAQARIDGTAPDALSAIEIVVRPDRQGEGLSGQMLAAMRENAARLGFAELLAPVRPNAKTDIAEPMAAYALRVREDGLPVDPWLRVHVRAGGVIDKVATRSMVISGTLREWRDWTGLPFDHSGPVLIPKALAPAWCDVEHDWAVYVEPNVWIRHCTERA